jgi:hypothetical protein
MSKYLWAIVLLATCVAPMIIGALSSSLPKAALGAGVVMCLVALVAFAVFGRLGYLPIQDASFGRSVLRALAVIPGMMSLGVIGYGFARGLQRLLAARKAKAPRLAQRGLALRHRQGGDGAG